MVAEYEKLIVIFPRIKLCFSATHIFLLAQPFMAGKGNNSFIWSTHSRDPLIDRKWRPSLLTILNEEVKSKGGITIRHNAMPDHVHLLVRLQPKIAPSDFIGKVKGATSFCVNREIETKYKLQWQEGYGVLSLRQDELITVSRYIDRQEDHHKTNKLSDLLETINVEEDDWGIEWVG